MASSNSRSSLVAPKSVEGFCGLSSSFCVSTKNKSKGRRFYGCRFYPDVNKYCGFFHWLDIIPQNEVHGSGCSDMGCSDMSFVSRNEEEVNLLRNKTRKQKEKLKNLRRDALKLELESVRLGEANKKLQLYVILSWMVTCVVLSYVFMNL